MGRQSLLCCANLRFYRTYVTSLMYFTLSLFYLCFLMYIPSSLFKIFLIYLFTTTLLISFSSLLGPYSLLVRHLSRTFSVLMFRPLTTSPPTCVDVYPATPSSQGTDGWWLWRRSRDRIKDTDMNLNLRLSVILHPDITYLSNSVDTLYTSPLPSRSERVKYFPFLTKPLWRIVCIVISKHIFLFTTKTMEY